MVFNVSHLSSRCRESRASGSTLLSLGAVIDMETASTLPCQEDSLGAVVTEPSQPCSAREGTRGSEGELGTMSGTNSANTVVEKTLNSVAFTKSKPSRRHFSASGETASSRRSARLSTQGTQEDESRRLRVRKQVEYNVSKIIHKAFYEHEEPVSSTSRRWVRVTRTAAAADSRLEPRQSRTARFEGYLASLGNSSYDSSVAIRRTRHGVKRGKGEGAEAEDPLTEAIHDDDMDAVYTCLHEGQFVSDSHIAEAIQSDSSPEVLELLFRRNSMDPSWHDTDGKITFLNCELEISQDYPSSMLPRSLIGTASFPLL